tara:strand:+ start:1056 stop:1736 length:681 start_codon:yes stop_codon:yes gene_type:complete
MQVKHSGKLALFDLDNTLLEGDSDHAWGEFLVSKNLVEESTHRAKNDYFYDQYKRGVLDIHGYVAFTLEPVMHLELRQREELHSEFMAQSVAPIVLDKGQALVRRHLAAGDFCVIITATNEFIAAPIAALFDIDLLIATELQTENGRYNGKIQGTPCYQMGKVSKLKAWIADQVDQFDLSEAVFYSDSINDLPLLQEVATPIAVDPDQSLRETAQSEGWKILSLRN